MVSWLRGRNSSIRGGGGDKVIITQRKGGREEEVRKVTHVHVQEEENMKVGGGHKGRERIQVNTRGGGNTRKKEGRELNMYGV